MPITGTITLTPNEQIEGVRASLFLGEESIFPLKERVTLHLTPELRPDGNIRYRSRFVVKDENGKEEALASPNVIARLGQSFSVRLGDLGYAFKP